MVLNVLDSTIMTIGERATYFNEMHEIFALFQFQAISDEIRGHFAQLDVCLRMFSVRLPLNSCSLDY